MTRPTVAPKGDRVLLRLQVVRHDHAREWLHRFLPGVSAAPVKRVSLWVCNLDGTGLREIGVSDPVQNVSQPLAFGSRGRMAIPKPGIEHYDDILNVQWTPDSKHISYVLNGSLYVVPAD